MFYMRLLGRRLLRSSNSATLFVQHSPLGIGALLLKQSFLRTMQPGDDSVHMVQQSCQAQIWDPIWPN